MKNNRLELAFYVVLFVIFCAVIFFTGFITGFKTGIEKGVFIKESGIKEMRKGHFNKPPLPFLQGPKPVLKNKDDVMFFLEGADRNTDVTIKMITDQMAIANKRNYSTGKFNKILSELSEEKIEIGIIKQSVLSGEFTGNLLDKGDKKMGNFKKVMEEIRKELNGLQEHINNQQKK